MLLKVNCWTNWITVTKCYCWRGPWRHLRMNPISGKHTLRSWAHGKHLIHLTTLPTKPSLSQYPSMQDDMKDEIYWPVLPDSLIVQVRNVVLSLAQGQKQGKDQTSLFHALSTTPAWINGKTSISLLHTFGPFFPSSPSKHSRLTLVVDMIQIPYSPVSSEQQYFCFSILGFPPRSIKLRSNAFEWARTT